MSTLERTGLRMGAAPRFLREQALQAFLGARGWQLTERTAASLVYVGPGDVPLELPRKVEAARLDATVTALLQAVAGTSGDVEALRRELIVQSLSGEMSLKDGEVDPETGHRIEAVIEIDELYVVYLYRADERRGSELETWWWVADAYGALPDGFGEVLNRVAMFEAEPIGHLDAHIRAAFRRLLAESVARALSERSKSNALMILDRAEAFLAARNAESARATYLAPAAITTALALGVAAALYLLAGSMSGVASAAPALTLLCAACAGSIGAFGSVFYRLTGVALDPRGGKWLLRLEGTLRIVVGILVALIVAWAVRAKWLFGFMSGGGDELLLVCSLAGASERLLPTLVQRIDEQSALSAPKVAPSAQRPLPSAPASKRDPPGDPVPPLRS